jgi:integrase
VRATSVAVATDHVGRQRSLLREGRVRRGVGADDCFSSPSERPILSSATFASNGKTRLLAKAVERADVRLAKQDHPPLPEPMTPHSLRRTFASVLLSLGEEVPYVMEQLGHTDPKVTLGIYARVMRRSEGDRDRLRALVDGGDMPNVSADVRVATDALASSVESPTVTMQAGDARDPGQWTT